MGTKRTSISRAEAGRTRASINFLERYARALGVPMTVTFGAPTKVHEAERWERARGFWPRLDKDHRGIYPQSARYIGLAESDDVKCPDRTQQYRNLVTLIARSGEGPQPWRELDPKDLSAPAAVASIWYDEIDWDLIYESIVADRKIWRADIKVRTKARQVIAARGP